MGFLKISIIVIIGATKLKFSEEIDLFMLITNQLPVEPQPNTSRDICNPRFCKLWFYAGKLVLMIFWKPYCFKHSIFETICRNKRASFDTLFVSNRALFRFIFSTKVSKIMVPCRNFMVFFRKTLGVIILGHQVVENLIFFLFCSEFHALSIDILFKARRLDSQIL